MSEFAETLYNELAEDLSLIHDLGDLPVRRLTLAVHATAAATQKLRAHLEVTPFTCDTDEINLFKHWKPKFAAEQYYALEKFTIENNRPLTDPALLRSYYEQELAVVNRFFSQYEFLYQYFKFGFIELDHLLFLRANIAAADFLIISADLDPVFSTKGDHLFAKFIAYEKLREFLLDFLHGRERNNQPFKSRKGRELAWTGDKTNLVELAYGLYDTRQINDGDVDIADIIDWLESSLQINLGRYYQVFTDIKARKTVSRTRYIDHIRAMILKHIDEGDAFMPQKPKTVSGSGKRP